MDEHKIQRHESVVSFLDQNRNWLHQNEIANNEIIASAQLLDSGYQGYEPPTYLATFLRDSEVCGCAIQALPDALTVSDVPQKLAKPLLVDRLQVGSPIEWLTATEKDAQRFGDIWERDLGKSWSVKYRWLIHALSKVDNLVSSVPGRLRMATESDTRISGDWASMYAIESPSPIDISSFFHRKLKEGNLFFWDHCGPKTIMAVSGRTQNVVRISAVFTPSEYRGSGYAKAGVSALCVVFLQQGLGHCILTTNEAKPQTARLYSAIGFQVVNARMSISLSD
jgi:hypothetical protein